MDVHFGFSYVGLIFWLMLIIPNIIWSKNKPENYEKYVRNESKILLVFERVGEIAVTCFLMIFNDFNINKISERTVFSAFAFLLMVLYEIYWIKYFKSERKTADMYCKFLGIPVAGTTLPVAAFLLPGVYGKNIFLIISTVILGIGHIGIHLNHSKEIR